VKLVDVVNESIKCVERARARIDKSRLGKRIMSHTDLNDASELRQSVACPHVGSIHPAAWMLNMNYSVVCHRIEVGLFVYNPKGGSK